MHVTRFQLFPSSSELDESHLAWVMAEKDQGGLGHGDSMPIYQNLEYRLASQKKKFIFWRYAWDNGYRAALLTMAEWCDERDLEKALHVKVAGYRELYSSFDVLGDQ